MTKKEILEGNKLIAEFMGYKFMDYRNCIYFGPEYVVDEIKCNSPTNDDNYAHICSGNRCKNYRNLLYNSSWDKLMPVVEKIESTNRKVEISECTCFIYPNETLENYDEYNYEITTIYPTKIKAVYNAVVKFIKWYNQSKLADKVFKKKTYRSRKKCRWIGGIYTHRPYKNYYNCSCMNQPDYKCIGVNCGYYKTK